VIPAKIENGYKDDFDLEESERLEQPAVRTNLLLAIQIMPGNPNTVSLPQECAACPAISLGDIAELVQVVLMIAVPVGAWACHNVRKKRSRRGLLAVSIRRFEFKLTRYCRFTAIATCY